MIPKLFSAAETAFTTEGLGRLSDAISCVVTEERNGKYELEMDYPVDGIHFSEIAHSCYIYAKPSDNGDPQPFSVYSISKPIGGRCTIRAEHISYRLINIPVTPFSSSSCSSALQELKTNAVESCPFTFWTDKTSSGTFKMTEPASLRSRLAGSEGSILDAFGGGEYEWDGMTVKLYAQRGANNGVTLRYGKNITDLKQEENIQNTFTGVMPYWKKEEQDGTTSLLMLNERVVYSSNAGNFPFNRTKILNCSEKWENQPTQAQLRSYATNYVQETGVGVPEVSITVKFLPLWQTEEYKNIANLEHVNLCDIVTVKFEKLGISASAKVVRTKYDTLKERYDEIELGDAKRSLSTSIRSDIDAARNESNQKIKEAKSFLREEMEDAISQIVQGDDGYIVFNYDGSDRRTQILAMDTMDVQTAQKILMINYQGIGGFTNGISDPSGYKLAITTDGNIVAESIAAGTIKSALLMGAVLKVGGSTTNGTGSIQIYDDDGNNGVGDTLIGRWDRNGLKCYKGEIQGPKITVGGASNTSGSITVVDADDELIGKWDVNGIAVYKGLIQNTLELWDLDMDYDNKVTALMKMEGIELSFRRNNKMCGLITAYPGAVETTSIPRDLGQAMYVLGGTSLMLGIACNTSGTYDKTNNMTVFHQFRKSPSHSGYEDICQQPLVLWDNMFLGSGYIYYDWDTKSGAYIKFTNYSGETYPRLEIKARRITLSVTNGAYYNNNEIAVVSSSSKRYKHNIKKALTEDRDPHNLLKLPVAEFVFNNDHPTQYADMKGKTIPGIIAEDVAEIYPSAAITNTETGEIESWDERRIIPGMLALIQEQAEKIKELEARLERLGG